MTVSRRVRFPAYLSALLLTSACVDCGGPDDDGGTPLDSGPGHDAGHVDGGDPPPPDGGTSDAGADDAGPAVLPSFQYATDCDVNAGGGDSSLDVVDAFPGLTFNDPLFMTPLPGTSRLVVIEQGGMIYSFDPSDPVASKTPFLDLPQAIQDYGSETFSGGGERGLLGIAFHPSFESNRTFYLSYTKVDDADGELHSIISRFTMTVGDPNTADPASEYELLSVFQPYSNHNGGMISFGPDGYLYIGLGDGGDSGDPDGNGQDTKTLLGSMLRIDVDTEDAPKRYSVPPGNPFADGADGNQPEIFAWGLRNPWRWSFDREAGDLWIADVGQGTWEEVNWIPASILATDPALNFGWNTTEGYSCYPPSVVDCELDGLFAPDRVYHHDEGLSVTGGYAYRGNSMPQRVGKYFYGDYVTRSVWIYDHDAPGDNVAPVFTAPQSISSFAEDQDGELYLLGYASDGKIWRVVDNSGPPEAPPATLSATGCFSDLATRTPASGVVPFDVNLALWSDGSEKRRWLVLPPNGKIDFAEPGKWGFPTGTVFIKEFAMDTTWGDESTRVLLETRFIVVEPSGVRGFTYRWRDDGSDADLLNAGDTRELELTFEPGGAPTSYTWNFPAPGQCLQCHTTASGGILGLETAQLNRDNRYGDVVINQMSALDEWDLFASAPTMSPESHHRFPAQDDDGADLDERARAWLHVNCAHCHLPGGPTGRDIDLLYTTPLADMNVCDVPPSGSDFGLAGVRLIKPGDPDASLLYYRDNNAVGRMPPLGTTLIDAEAGALQRAWIEGMESCPQ